MHYDHQSEAWVLKQIMHNNLSQSLRKGGADFQQVSLAHDIAWEIFYTVKSAAPEEEFFVRNNLPWDEDHSKLMSQIDRAIEQVESLLDELEEVPALYQYVSEIDDHGTLHASVNNAKGKTIFSIRNGTVVFCMREMEGIQVNETNLLENGAMKDLEDVEGLANYLIKKQIIQCASTIAPQSAAASLVTPSVTSEVEYHKNETSDENINDEASETSSERYEATLHDRLSVETNLDDDDAGCSL